MGEVPELSNREFRQLVIEACRRERRVSALFADSRDGEGGGDLVELYAVLAEEDTASLLLARTRIEADVFESLTPDCPQVHLFEREIAEQYGCVPRGHPWLKPVRFHAPYRRPASGVETGTAPVVGVMDYYRVEGDEVHEVAVGPVHAGIIEPGHFRFQCHGETVFHLEISLGYQHRGIERHLVGGPTPRTVHYMETLAGDTTLGHATAYCHAVEALARIHAPAKAQFIRGIALELERLANHVGDLGALAGDVGYLPTASFCGRIRGDYLNMSALLCGNRFGRDLTRVGGVRFDIDEAVRESLVDAAGRRGAGHRECREPALGFVVGDVAVRGCREHLGGGRAGDRARGPGRPRQWPGTRRANRLSQGRLPLQPRADVHVEHG